MNLQQISHKNEVFTQKTSFITSNYNKNMGGHHDVIKNSNVSNALFSIPLNFKKYYAKKLTQPYQHITTKQPKTHSNLLFTSATRLSAPFLATRSGLHHAYHTLISQG